MHPLKSRKEDHSIDEVSHIQLFLMRLTMGEVYKAIF